VPMMTVLPLKSKSLHKISIRLLLVRKSP
jgi:hypothetical protein